MSVLSGIRILSIEQYGAAPFGTQLLSDMGAEVIKIEQPDGLGDVARQVGPHFDKKLPETADSLFFQSLNCGKKSICLDLRQKEGLDILHALVKTVDVVANNLRGDVPAKLGLSYDHLKAFNPKIVCAHITGYGRESERASWPGYDYLMQAEAGYFSLTGEPDSPPARMGLSIIDYMTGVMMSLGISSTLVDVQRGGLGRDIDVSLFDVALYNLNYISSWYLNAGKETIRQPRSAHPSLTPCQLYKTADGWIYLMCNKQKFWELLCTSINRPEWINDARFTDFPQRFAHRDVLTNLLDAELSTRTTDEWMEIFAGTVPASPVLSASQALDAPFAQTSIKQFVSPQGHALKLPGSPIKLRGNPGINSTAPTLGEHTQEILAKIGIGADAQAKLKTRGVL